MVANLDKITYMKRFLSLLVKGDGWGWEGGGGISIKWVEKIHTWEPRTLPVAVLRSRIMQSS
jgi:hypothetical protein